MGYDLVKVYIAVPFKSQKEKFQVVNNLSRELERIHKKQNIEIDDKRECVMCWYYDKINNM